jgi:uncharacterized protein YecE (DUF72 family)
VDADLLLGTQGWSHPAWVGPFYPAGTPQSSFLSVYARAFSTVEADSTFYAVPAAPIVREWRERVPDGFVFSLKVPQEITHTRQLVDVREVLAQFLERAELLGDHLGPILVQLSPAFCVTEERRTVLEQFLRELPGGYRWAVEFRDPRWITDAVLDWLRVRNVAVALVDGRWVRRRVMLELAARPTANFAYVRWMGPSRALADYSRVQLDRERELAQWAAAVRSLRGQVRTIFGYFNNHFQGHGPHSVRALQRLVGQTPVEPRALHEQVELFS